MSRMRWVVMAVVALPLMVSAQTWEKMLMPGLTYRMEVDLKTPRLTHALRYMPGAPGVTSRPEVAGTKMFSIGEDKGRETVSSMVSRSNAVAGINADFFPFTGDPLGAMVRNGELLSRPFPNRSVLAWGPKGALATKLTWTGSVSVAADRIDLNGLNEECGPNMLVLNTESASVALSKGVAKFFVVKINEGVWRPTGQRAGTVEQIVDQVERLDIAPGTVVLAAQGTKALEAARLKVGMRVVFEMNTAGLDWRDFDQVVGGGPTLLRAGRPEIDFEAQGFKDGFANNRHPRTAVGRTAQGELIFVAIDGRQEMSAGATLMETAEILLLLGAVDAINLDGGGSTALNLFGVTVNRPSDGTERKVANAVLWQGPAIKPSEGEYKIIAPAEMAVGQIGVLTIKGADGKMVPAREVLWSAQGGAWIDQGGTLRAIKPGTVKIDVYVRGQRLVLEVKVTGIAPIEEPKKEGQW
jgi:exopolysaccharide biosynthesis protein